MIGILAVIGGLLPIFFNSTLKESIDDLEHEVIRAREMTENANQTANDATASAESALATSETLTGKLGGVNEKVESMNSSIAGLSATITSLSDETAGVKKIIPSVDTLILQSSVSRFLNIGVTRLKEPNRKEFLENVFEGLIKGFSKFKEAKFSDFNEIQKKIFTDSVGDLLLGVKNLTLSTVIDSKKEFNFLKQLSGSL